VISPIAPRRPHAVGRRGVLWYGAPLTKVGRWIWAALCCCVALPVAAAELQAAKGTLAQPLVLKTPDGAVQDLARYRGRVVLVNFWATWCEPCRDEMPSIQKLKEKFAGQPFDVIAVNVDEPESRVRAFLEKTPLQFTVVLDPGKQVTKSWNVRILPASYVIGRDGRVRYSVVGELDWSDANVVKAIGTLLQSR
jgi:peroxiredoxin